MYAGQKIAEAIIPSYEKILSGIKENASLVQRQNNFKSIESTIYDTLRKISSADFVSPSLAIYLAKFLSQLQDLTGENSPEFQKYYHYFEDIRIGYEQIRMQWI